MSITSRINEMSSHIEQAYDELQGLGADLTNVNKNIENISMVLDDIYDSMPQVSGEGTSLTLDDTRVGKIKSTLKGNTSQDGTPTPTTPIPVNVVSGDNEIQINNLIDISKFYVRTDNNARATNQNNRIELLSNTSYTIIANNDFNYGYFELDSNLNVLTDSGWKNGTTNFITNSNTKYIWFNLRYSNNSAITDINNFMKNINIKLFKENEYEEFLISLPVENLFDKSTITSGSYISDTGAVVANNTTFYSDYIKVTLSTTYRISGRNNGWSTIALYNSSKTFISRLNESNNCITTTDQTHYIRVIGALADIDTIQVEKGSKANSYTPYGTTPIELCKIGNYQDEFRKSTGKNLFDKETITNGYYYDTSGNYVAVNETYVSDFIEVNANDSYTLQTSQSSSTKRVNYFDSNKTWLSQVNTNNTDYTFTTPNNTKYIRVSFNQLVNKDNIQIEEGTTATTYEPYGTNEWYLEKNIGKRILNGTENWSIQTTWSAVGDKTNAFYISRPTELNPGQPCYCDYLKYDINVAAFLSTDEYGLTYSASLILRMPKSLENGAALQNWLASNNITIWFVLTSPTYTKIEGTLKEQLETLKSAMSYDTQTNISQTNNDLPFIISASALKEWQENTSLNSTLSMVNSLSLGNTLNTQEIENNIQPIEVDNIEPLEEEENEES